MNSPLVLTVIGPDRPGLVDALASAISSEGGNWLESRMCHLGGEFAGILSVNIDSQRKDALISALKQLDSQGLNIVIQASHDANRPDNQCSEVAQIEIVGQDRPGIVSQISHVFTQFGVNVEELNTECRSAPMSGEMLFHANAKVCIPASCSSDDLKADLEKIAADLLVDVSFELT